MAKFEFPDFTEVTLTNVNLRKELHGDEHVQACDLAFQRDCASDVLETLFQPGLRASLFHNAAADAGQMEAELDLGGLPNLPNLKFPSIGPKFKFGAKDKVPGYRIEFDRGLGGDSNIYLELCTLTGKAFEVFEGGTTKVYWTVQAHGEQLDEEVLGQLALMGGEKVTMRLLAPAVALEEKPKHTTGDDGTNPLPFDADTDEPQDPFIKAGSAEDAFVKTGDAVH